MTHDSRNVVLTGFGLGSNINADSNIDCAIAALQGLLPGLMISPVYRCRAVGFDGEPFLNLVVAAESSIPLLTLQAEVKALEAASGRTGQESKYSGRTLDIDILFHGSLICNEPGLRLPRRDVVKYPYVLKPLVDILPQWQHPELETSAAQLWQLMASSAGGEDLLMLQHGVSLYRPASRSAS